MIPPAKRGGRRRSVNVREVLNGIFYILWTGCQWKALPKDLPPKSTVHDYLELWNWDGTLERIHHELYVAVREQEGREPSPTLPQTFLSPVAHIANTFALPQNILAAVVVWTVDTSILTQHVKSERCRPSFQITGGQCVTCTSPATSISGDAPDFVEVGEAGIAVDHAMRRQRAVQRSW